jgi:hypothetical protein
MYCTKALIIAVFSILLSTFAFTGCNKDSNPADPGQQNDLVGIWNLSAMTAGGKPVTFADMGIQSLFATFKADLKYSVTMTHLDGTSEAQNGTYPTTGNQITLTDSTGLVTSGTYALSGNNLTFSLTNSELGTYTQTFIRQ